MPAYPGRCRAREGKGRLPALCWRRECPGQLHLSEPWVAATVPWLLDNAGERGPCISTRRRWLARAGRTPLLITWIQASPTQRCGRPRGTTSGSATRLAGAGVLHRRDLGSAAGRDGMEVEAHRLRNRVV